MGHLRCLKTVLEPAGPLPGRISPEVARLNVRGRKAFPRGAKTKGSQMRDYIGRRDLLKILASAIAAANPGVRNARTPVACGAFQGAKTVRRRHTLAVQVK